MVYRFDLPIDVAKKFIRMKFSADLKIELLDETISQNQALIIQYIGAAYIEKGIVKWAVICGRAGGNIVPQYDIIMKEKCFFISGIRMCKVERKDVLRGLTLEEIETIKKILRAKGSK